MFSLNSQTTNLVHPASSHMLVSKTVTTSVDTRVDLYNVFCRLQPLFAPLPLAPTMSPAGALTAHERLLAAVSAADALPRGTTFQKVKGARDRLRAELSSVQRTDGDELVKSATACARRLNQRLSRMRKLGMDATTEPAPAEPAPAEPAPAEAPMKTEPAPAEAHQKSEAPIATTPAMSSAPLCAIQNLWDTLATEQTPGNIEMYRLFRRLRSTISSVDLPVEDLQMIRPELQEFHEFMEFHYKQCFGPCIVRVSVSTGIFCLTNLLAEVQARIASLARGKKRKADEP